MTTRRSISVLLLAMITVTMIFLVPYLDNRRAFLAILCMLAAMLGVMWMGGKGPR
jgi:hypothetical protein